MEEDLVIRMKQGEIKDHEALLDSMDGKVEALNKVLDSER